jgi:hypothetical protein
MCSRRQHETRLPSVIALLLGGLLLMLLPSTPVLLVTAREQQAAQDGDETCGRSTDPHAASARAILQSLASVGLRYDDVTLQDWTAAGQRAACQKRKSHRKIGAHHVQANASTHLQITTVWKRFKQTGFAQKNGHCGRAYTAPCRSGDTAATQQARQAPTNYSQQFPPLRSSNVGDNAVGEIILNGRTRC